MTAPALVPLTAAAAELGLGRTTAYILASEVGELVPGVPVLKVRGRLYAHRAQLDRFKAGETVTKAASNDGFA